MYMDIPVEVLKRVKPTHLEEERVKKFVDQLLSVAKTVSGLDVVIVGSLGKFTWLAGDHDIDLFIMFDSTVEREELERLGLEFNVFGSDGAAGRCNGIKEAVEQEFGQLVGRGRVHTGLDADSAVHAGHGALSCWNGAVVRAGRCKHLGALLMVGDV